MLSDLLIVLGIFVVLFLALVIMSYRSQKTKASPDELRLAAERGDVVAQFELAQQLNGAEAFDWYLQAARQDHIRAQLIVAEAYLEGKHCPLSQTEACRWLERAAELGASEARERLATLLPETVADEPDPTTDTELTELMTAAQAGDTEAQYQLGIVYYHGEGAPRDLEQALNWFKLAAEQGDAEAQFNLGLMIGRGEGTAKNINQSVEWFKKAAEQGHAAATDILQKMIK
ncbi:MAG: putative beta-lactamase HcpC precursor [Deltaproteobacteria bacterium ADurb.Bin510]|nr:MAG: putative beta-lactamase HcpC precursor [Deltaproteobacteria bacterium ADurb.Bin510]